MFFNTLILSAAAFGSTAFAAQPAYAQCGGQGFTGETTCVSGWACKYSNDWYSQCLPSTSGNSCPNAATSKAAAVVSTKPSIAAPVKSSAPAEYSVYTPPKSSAPAPAKSSAPAPAKSSTPVQSSAPAKSSTPAKSSSSSGTTYKASFTQYGSTDTWGSGNCNVKTTACGYYTAPGYSAALSQNGFGVGPGAGAGPGCGTCWKLTAQTDSSGNTLSNAGNSIVVQVTNLCPASGNPLCSQNGLTGTNQYGANLNFDLCIDSGASAALFGNSGVGLAVGSAVQVDCSQWSGKIIG